MSSTRLAVSSDSRMPTSAIASAYGAIVSRVSRVNGTSGKNQDGRLSGSSHSSPTFGTSIAPTIVKAVRDTSAHRRAGARGEGPRVGTESGEPGKQRE